MRSKYREVKVNKEKIVNYIAMPFGACLHRPRIAGAEEPSTAV